MHNDEFIVSSYRSDFAGLLAPRIKGKIISSDPTQVKMRLILPLFPMIFLIGGPLYFFPSFFTTETMTINGVLRAPTIGERFIFGGMFVVIPAILVFTNFILPLRQAERMLREKLSLTEIE